MKKKFFILFLAVVFSLLFSFTAFAYEIPTNAYKMTLSSNAGDITVAVPYNMARYISYENNELISQYSSTITLYGDTIVAGGSRPLNVRLQPFQTAEYRYTDNNYTWSEFVIYEIVDSNIPLLQETDFTLFSQDVLVNMIMVLVGGTIIILLLKKR